MSCQRNGYVLPGTLLGLFPGVVLDPAFSTASKPNAEYPYLKRYDNYCVQYQSIMLPYPVKPGYCKSVKT